MNNDFQESEFQIESNNDQFICEKEQNYDQDQYNSLLKDDLNQHISNNNQSTEKIQFFTQIPNKNNHWNSEKYQTEPCYNNDKSYCMEIENEKNYFDNLNNLEINLKDNKPSSKDKQLKENFKQTINELEQKIKYKFEKLKERDKDNQLLRKLILEYPEETPSQNTKQSVLGSKIHSLIEKFINNLKDHNENRCQTKKIKEYYQKREDLIKEIGEKQTDIVINQVYNIYYYLFNSKGRCCQTIDAEKKLSYYSKTFGQWSDKKLDLLAINSIDKEIVIVDWKFSSKTAENHVQGDYKNQYSEEESGFHYLSQIDCVQSQPEVKNNNKKINYGDCKVTILIIPLQSAKDFQEYERKQLFDIWKKEFTQNFKNYPSFQKKVILKQLVDNLNDNKKISKAFKLINN